MASAEECRDALEKLAGRLSEMSSGDRASYFGNRSMSVEVTDLGVMFVTRFTDTGVDPIREAAPGEAPADIRLAAASDDVLHLAESPANIARMWASGKVKVHASMRDLLTLRKLL
jgi:SCP-2 sterol transfer family